MTITIDGNGNITNSGGYTGDGVSFADATPTNTLVTTTDGNVGIGTSSVASGYRIESTGSVKLTSDYAVYAMTTTNGRGWRMGNTSNGTNLGYFYIQGTTDNWSSSFVDGLFISSAGNVGVGTSAPNFKLTVNGNFLNTFTNIAPGNTTSEFVGMSLSNPYTSGTGVSFIDSQGRNNISDSHIFFIHYADYGSAINFATQPAGTNTDRRAVRLTIGPSGLITAPAVYSTSVTPSRVVYTDTAGNLGYNASILAAKTNVADLIDTDWLAALRPITFNYRKLDEDRNYTDEAEADLEYGLIAEEVEGVNTELVFYDQTENGPELRGVHYNKLIVPLLAEVQKLRAELTDTKARLAAVEGAI